LNINFKEKEKRSPKTVLRKPGFIDAILSHELRFGSNELSMAKKEEFYSEASILLGSGLDIKSCLSVIVSEQTKKKQIEFFQSISEKIVNGKNLSDALLESGKISPFEYYTLKIGEETGRLADVLRQLSDHYNRQIKQKRQIINTFSYPAIVILTAIMVVIFMMTFIVPLFEELFNRFHGELPLLTKFILRSSRFISTNIYFIFLILAGTIFSLLLVRRHPTYRKVVALIVLRIPVLNSIVIKIYLSKFCQTMALLNSARIPIVTSIQLIRKIIGFYPFERALEQIEERVVNGGLLYEALREHSLFDPKIVSLTKVGEEVNQLNVIYQKLNQQYHDEVQHKITLLNSMLEPILIIFIGLFVAVILVSMYLPMFKMSNTMF